MGASVIIWCLVGMAEADALTRTRFMKPYSLCIVSIFLALWITSSYATPQDIVLGVLEDVPGTYAGDSNSWHVRATFYKTQNGWQAFPSRCQDQSCLKSVVAQYPAEIELDIRFLTARFWVGLQHKLLKTSNSMGI